MASRCTTTPKLGAALCLVLGMGIALSSAPALAQSTGADPGTSTAQPPASSDLDTDYWVLVRDSSDPEAMQSYLYSFPSGKYSDIARQKLVALREQQVKSAGAIPGPAGQDTVRTPGVELTKTSPASLSPAPPAAENKELARALQRELKRVGCLDAEADGVWGDKSRTALKDFVRHANLSIAGEEPNVAVLDAASARRARVCPLVCDNDEKVVGDRCVPVTQNKPRQVRREPVQERRQAERPAARPRERESYNSGNSGNSGKKLCFGGERNVLVACP